MPKTPESNGIHPKIRKNAHSKSPGEPNLLNIDQLIAQSTDEQEIKGLKKQKRLLRNRQAALDSRQRKQQHTERLEDEKKEYTALVNELEKELTNARILVDQLTHEKQQYEFYLRNLKMEMEEMVRAHTLETGDLRGKISVLTEHVQELEHIAMSSAPSSSGFNADCSDIDSFDINSFLNE